ncbi:MAG TPA: cysteine desulfurase [Clostridiales bacterium]|jgi:cysteine desulfurase|nr:cysteine desulfurase [Clostridiales bacterium]
MIYFDNAATTKVSDEAARAVYLAMTESYGNPSSSHALGREAREIIGTARKTVAAAIGAQPETIYFTSGGTEADNLAIISAAENMKRRGGHILTTAIEHDAVLKCMAELERQGFEVEYIKPDRHGDIPVSAFESALREDTVLVSLMLVNNEVGSVLPVAEVSKMLRRRKSQALLHTDAVQGFLKIPFTVKSLGADLLTLSAHKIHGPKGVGALYVRKGLRLLPRSFGGGQESGLRAGTESVPLIAGFGAAVEQGLKSRERDIAEMSKIRDYIRAQLRVRLPEAKILGSAAAPHILCLSLPGYKSEVLLNWLDMRGICVSKGSACKKGRRSHVLEAMGLSSGEIDGALRVSLSAQNTMEEAEAFVSAFAEAKNELYGVLGK